MANINKEYLDFTQLSAYDTLLKSWANSANQLAYKTVLESVDGNHLYFYKKPNAILGTDTPDVTIDLGGGDLATKLDALADVCGATWDSTNNVYTIALDQTFAAGTDTVVEALNELKSQINTLNGNDSTAGSVAKSVKDAVEALDVTEFPLAEVNNNVVTIHGISETDGAIAVGNSSSNDVVLEEIAYTGAAEDVSIADAGSLITATNVEDALQELAAASAGGVASKTVYITETSGGSSDPYSKRYGIYQGSTGSASSPVIGEKLVDIDIPKDMVVEDGEVVDVVFVSADNSLHEGSASGTDVTTEIKGTGTATSDDAGKYIKLTIANATSSHLWIKATDLVDIYTAQQNATQIQLAIDSNNVISATVVAGSIGSTELDSTVNTSLALANSAVQSVTASDPTTGTDGTISVDGTEVAVKGLGSAAYTASTAYDAAGTAAAAVAALDTSSDVGIASENSSTGVVTFTGSIAETDGIVEAGSADTISFTPITTAQVNSLFA